MIDIYLIPFFLYKCIVKWVQLNFNYCLDWLVRRAPMRIAAPPRIVRGSGMTPKRAKEPMKAATGSRYSHVVAFTASILLRA